MGYRLGPMEATKCLKETGRGGPFSLTEIDLDGQVRELHGSRSLLVVEWQADKVEVSQGCQP